MGLTIHYSFRSNVRTPQQAKFLMTALRRRALDLPFEFVGEIIQLTGETCDFHRCDPNEPHRWLLIQAARHVSFPRRDGRCTLPVPPREIVDFETLPGNGSEPANFGLCRFPGVVYLQDPQCPGHKRRLRTNLSGWSWSSFCKTQHAADHGREHFETCHLAIVHLLDYALRINILKSVHDEGELWEHRHARSGVQQAGKLKSNHCGEHAPNRP